MNKRALCVLLLVPALIVSAFSSPSEDQEQKAMDAGKAEVQHVLHEFSRCIKEKDWQAFEKLFLAKDTPWIGVVEKAKRPMAKAAGMLDEQGFFKVTRAQFQKQIDSTPGISEEIFKNLVIDIDDGLANVKADYDFLAAGKVLNHGVESWNLVESESGWKIVSVLYSLHRGAR